MVRTTRSRCTLARTEWQKEPSAERKKEHCRTSVKMGLPEKCGIVQRNILVICATGAIKMTDDKTAFEERDDKYFDGTLDSFWNIGWVHPKHSERRVERTSVWKENVEGRFLSYVPRARGGSSGCFMIADCEDLQEAKASDILCQKIQKAKI